MRALITGANGFIGRALLRLAAPPHSVDCVASVRRQDVALPADVRRVQVGDLDATTDWSRALDGVDVIVHSAARVHVMGDVGHDALDEYRRTNVAGTLKLAMDAARAGVRRFVFVSSIKVNGERTAPGRPFVATDPARPRDAYGLSKHEAEAALRLLALETGLEVVILRPVLVYGPGVAGNFLSMMRRLHRGVPLPLGGLENRRSFVALANLVDVIRITLDHPLAANQTFLISDGTAVSTTTLLEKTAHALGTRARLVSVPGSALRFGARLAGYAPELSRLCDSLEVDTSTTRELLDWAPAVGMDEALSQTARYFLDSVGK
jgi:UDP-N-acetyl-alpha-D-quinovosamine dehydrogenase